MTDPEPSAWIGQAQTITDTIAPGPLSRLAATIEAPPFDTVPPLWHWLYFLEAPAPSELGEDGHACRGGFLPPIDLPRRMWAGGRLRFLAPLPIGAHATRRSVIESVTEKSGRSGRLAFVTIRHEITAGGPPIIIEHQDLVFREPPERRTFPTTSPPPPTPAPTGHAWARTWRPDPVMLFRYSALTFNGHRIHYDRDYATGREGYPGLIVHGPLIATLLLDLVRRHRPAASVAAFEFRAIRPVFDDHPLTVRGQPDGNTVQLLAVDHEGFPAMHASATLAG